MTPAIRTIPKMNIHRLLSPTRPPARKLSYRKERELKRKREWDPEKENRKLTKGEEREWYQSRIQTIEKNMLRENENYEKIFREAVDAIARATPIEKNNPTSRTYQNIYAMLRQSAVQTLKLVRMEIVRAMLLMNKEINWGNNEGQSLKIKKRYERVLLRLMREEELLIGTLNDKKKFDQEVVVLMKIGSGKNPTQGPPRGA